LTYRARERTSGVIVADRLRSASTHWTRLKGLLGTRGLAPGHGLWLRPCNQVHMFGMRYAIDVVFLDDERRVRRTVSALAPGTISPRVPEASSVLELPAGTVTRVGLVEGAQIDIEGEEEAAVSSRIRTFNTVGCNVLLAILYGFFAAAHVAFARRTGQWATAMPLVIQESLLVALFLTRRRSLATSPRPVDWIVGIVGVFLPLLMRPIDPAGPLDWVGRPVQIVGLTLAVVAVSFLGRSVGVVPANRGVKTGGLYQVVRHPMYAAYIVSYFGYIASYPGLRNALVGGAAVIALNLRAILEERFLAHDDAYRTYLTQVRWRFLPYVY